MTEQTVAPRVSYTHSSSKLACTGRLLVATALCVLIACGSMAQAVSRATPEQLRELAKDSDKYLADPVANWSRVVSVVIRPGTRPDEELIKLFEDKLAKATSEEEKAICHFLLSKTYYWQGFRQFQKTRDRNVFTSLADKVIKEDLAAFALAEENSSSLRVFPARKEIIADLCSLLTSNLYGEQLAAELKQEVVRRFVNVLEKSSESTSSWGAELRGKVYRNLGIAERLVKDLPSETPTDAKELRKVMKQVAASSPKDAVRFADALAANLDLKAKASAESAWDVFQVYRDAGDARALAWLKKTVESHPQLGLSLYTFSHDAEPALSVQERDKYLQVYVKWGEDHVSDSDSIGAGQTAFANAASELMREKDFNRALLYADRGIKVPMERWGDLVSLYFAKGKCHKELGQPAEARKALERCLELAKTAPSKNRILGWAGELLRELPEEKGKTP